MKLGVCYYPEHWPQSRWATDAKMMSAGGLSIVRIGEFAWAKMEPAEDELTWDWLDAAIETLAGEGLQIVLGTPTATPPAWLCKAYPDILPVDSQGRRRHFGSRRHYCANSPAYQTHTRRIVTAMAGRYGQHPAVLGWQIDNEFGCHDTARCYCDHCALAFRDWLENKYVTLEALNDAWGTIFWSQTYSKWDEIDPPHLTVTEPNPSHVLDFYRFSSDSVVAYQQLQIDILRELSPDKSLTTNFMGNFPDLNYHDLARPLDFVAWDSYPTGHAEVQSETLYAPTDHRSTFAYDVGDPYITGFCHDLIRGLKPDKPFWIMEQQCGNINWSLYNTGVRPGTTRLWTWHALASGAEAVVYFRWRAVLYAQEQHHSGLLHHDTSPAVGYQDLLALKADRVLMEEISALPVNAHVAIVGDYNDLWAIQLQPHRLNFGYQSHLFVFYRALQRLGIPVTIVGPDADLSLYKLVIAPTVFLSDERLIASLTAFAEHGGDVLIGVRSGFKTLSNRVTDQPLPGPFRELIGGTVTDWHSLPPDVGYDIQSTIPGLGGQATVWAEALLPTPITPQREGITMTTGVRVAHYTSGPFASYAALMEKRTGIGRVFYLGWYPTGDQAETLLAYLTHQVGVPRLAELPSNGLIATARGPYIILLNFTDEPLTATIDGQLIPVGPRDVRIFKRLT